MTDRPLPATEIDGVHYQLRPFAPASGSQVAYRLIEAVVMVANGHPGLAAALAHAEKAVLAQVSVGVTDTKGDGQTRMVPLPMVFEKHFEGRSSQHGEVLAWAVQESGLPDFLSGAVKGVAPELLARLPSHFRKGRTGSSGDSSSPTT